MFGVAEASELVFVSAHTISSSDSRGPGVVPAGSVASSAALELRKYSVPPAPVANCPVPGDMAGQTVKPG